MELPGGGCRRDEDVPVAGGLSGHRLRRLLAVLAAAWLAVGCQGLRRSEPPPRLYTLTPKSQFVDVLPRADWQLLIDVPSAPATVDTTHIVLRRQPLAIEYYAEARWPDLAPRMVQRLIIESIENSGAIRAVGRDPVDLRADFVLKTELREFQAEYFHGDLPRIRVALLARLVAKPRGAIIGLERFEVIREAPANRLTAIVAAFDDALGSILTRLVVWTLKTADTARQNPDRQTAWGASPPTTITSGSPGSRRTATDP